MNNVNRQAFLALIAVSEGTAHLGDDGYNVIVGGELFTSYHDHPRKKVWIKAIRDYSTAAGRYQILKRYYDHYKMQLHLTDFTPHSQDLIAIQMIKECGALGDIDAGRVTEAIRKCTSRWASLPGGIVQGRGEQTYKKLLLAYVEAGGRLDSTSPMVA